MTRFLQPEFFWLFTLLPLVMLWRGRKGPVAAIEYSDVSLARDVARRSKSRIGNFLWLLPILAGALMIVGLARPQRGHSRTEVTANGIDIVLALDVSGSMQALDFLINGRRQNRIDVVKAVVAKFIDERTDDRIGIISFAGAPYLISPITLDHDWLQQNLERVTIGVGVRGKAPIPVRDQAGNMRIIMAQVDVDEKTLQTIATETGGKFYRATDTDSLQKIYEQINQYEKTAQTVQKFERYDELYPWAVIPAMAILALGSLLSQTRYRRLP